MSYLLYCNNRRQNYNFGVKSVKIYKDSPEGERDEFIKKEKGNIWVTNKYK